MTKTIPNGCYTASELVQRARALDVPGNRVHRGRKLDTYSYPVRLESGAILCWMVAAPAAEHYTGRK